MDMSTWVPAAGVPFHRVGLSLHFSTYLGRNGFYHPNILAVSLLPHSLPLPTDHCRLASMKDW